MLLFDIFYETLSNVNILIVCNVMRTRLYDFKNNLKGKCSCHMRNVLKSLESGYFLDSGGVFC